MKKVTIGVPIYNEGIHLEKTLASIGEQGDEILLFDNASTDETEAICRRFVAKNPRAVYHRHEKNLGALENFYRCLKKAKHPFFMWLGGHDLLTDNYVDLLRRTLSENPSAVLTFTHALRIDENDVATGNYSYPFASELASPSPWVRVLAVLKDLKDCSLFHGLFARKTLLKCWPKRKDWAAVAPMDHCVLAEIALRGALLLASEEPLYIRRDLPRSPRPRWEVMIETLYSEDHPARQRPGCFVPMSVYRGQIRTAADCFALPDTPLDFMAQANQILMDRWAKYWRPASEAATRIENAR